MMTSEEEKLISTAVELLDERYNPPVHSVAAALRTKSGKVYTSLNVDHFNGFVCAETAALSDAINHKEYSFDRIVAVRKDDRGVTSVVNMCGKCRQIFHDYAPDIAVIVSDGSANTVKSIIELLPHAFTRQRDKIQSVIAGTIK